MRINPEFSITHAENLRIYEDLSVETAIGVIYRYYGNDTVTLANFEKQKARGILTPFCILKMADEIIAAHIKL